MRRRPRGVFFLTSLAVLLSMSGAAFRPATPRLPALNAAAPGPDRFEPLLVEYSEYQWWMARWEDNVVVCEIVSEHANGPTLGDVYADCGKTIYEEWASQPPCLEKKTTDCEGYYIFLVTSWLSTREIAVELPPPVVWVSLEDCVPAASAATNVCEYIPKLVLTGQEPLPNETILYVEGTMDGQPFACDPICHILLAPTDEDGVEMEFWGYSSYGDSSPAFSARVRVAEVAGDNPDQSAWFVDVLSTQWTGLPPATCSDTWEAFPPVGGPPEWLSTPDSSEALHSDIPYSYLAGNLILQGVVDASHCADGGLLPAGGVNTCGQEAAAPAATDWQNRFDSLILSVAQTNGVPAQLLKRLFARESQFWPGVYKDSGDVGLGQLTENGADTTLLWNPSFYSQFCPLVLPGDACARGYLHLSAEQQTALRLALVASVNAVCEECPLGLDLTQADFSVSVFAHTLLANCEQSGRIVRNVTAQAPGQVATYEDMWKFTLVNYNAGPGCLSIAVRDTWSAGQPLDWANVSAHLTEACQGAIDYVDDISQ